MFIKIMTQYNIHVQQKFSSLAIENERDYDEPVILALGSRVTAGGVSDITDVFWWGTSVCTVVVFNIVAITVTYGGERVLVSAQPQ